MRQAYDISERDSFGHEAATPPARVPLMPVKRRRLRRGAGATLAVDDAQSVVCVGAEFAPAFRQERVCPPTKDVREPLREHH
jgi:hypothetical protein